ncbi:bifunctional folylpolyglutamate synthase/dihydrofolate synthase [Caproiciproducens sp. MSJ-32]|uniref:bifunctional folylpolyglutamate synthase/dihydrofolate synthase n=1 Tax=Caproiciproducens sp. MSJ-32 TaxID=2841527 RepID=UPI001C11B7B4|nr:folylpolyglutamate synthase/dihydrofolate synthase family protein [Caproiciproducens sp. MSJ-32]MBU5453971.1 bifunctional folylpolyglutamate synthase/dihydrofolate synthase [Caproiciproducens sp. MSJ-32]
MKDKDTLEYIKKLREFGVNYGLERTERLLELLGKPHKKIKFIHIAGTNGKGSTSVIIGNILMEHGYKVGFFNSPYLESMEESIRINNVNIKEEDLVSFFKEIRPFVKKVVEEGYGHPTEFEVLTCIMFLYLYRQKVDFGIIEVGLGGRMDSTNVIKPIISVITSISMDHINILGNSIKEIAYQKAGIIKKNINIVSAPQNEEVIEVIKTQAHKLNSKLELISIKDGKFIELLNQEKLFQRCLISGKNKNYDLMLPLLGEHQIVNLTLGIRVIEVLEDLGYIKIEENKLFEGVKNVSWNGRLEIIDEDPKFIIDAAHNVEGMKYLRKNIEKYFLYNNIYFILGILKDKEVEKMVEIISDLPKEIYLVTPNSNRALNSEELKKIVKKYNKTCISFDNYDEAINYAKDKAEKNDLIISAGSIYMIGEIRKLIKK